MTVILNAILDFWESSRERLLGSFSTVLHSYFWSYLEKVRLLCASSRLQLMFLENFGRHLGFLRKLQMDYSGLLTLIIFLELSLNIRIVMCEFEITTNVLWK